jgi:hypothetical protein
MSAGSVGTSQGPNLQKNHSAESFDPGCTGGAENQQHWRPGYPSAKAPRRDATLHAAAGGGVRPD